MDFIGYTIKRTAYNRSAIVAKAAFVFREVYEEMKQYIG